MIVKVSVFPLLTPTMQAGQDSDAGVGGTKEMCTMHAGYVLDFGVGISR